MPRVPSAKRKRANEFTSLSCSVDHANAVRHAAIELEMTKKMVLEQLIEGDSLVRRVVSAEYARINGDA